MQSLSADSSSIAARSERGHAPRRANPALDREAPEFAVRYFGDALSVANVQQLLAGYVSRTRVHPIIAARHGEHPGEGDGGQAGQQLMREPTKSAIFRYRLPRRCEPVRRRQHHGRVWETCEDRAGIRPSSVAAPPATERVTSGTALAGRGSSRWTHVRTLGASSPVACISDRAR